MWRGGDGWGRAATPPASASHCVAHFIVNYVPSILSLVTRIRSRARRPLRAARKRGLRCMERVPAFFRVVRCRARIFVRGAKVVFSSGGAMRAGRLFGGLAMIVSFPWYQAELGGHSMPLVFPSFQYASSNPSTNTCTVCSDAELVVCYMRRGRGEGSRVRLECQQNEWPLYVPCDSVHHPAPTTAGVLEPVCGKLAGCRAVRLRFSESRFVVGSE